jgi:hypothetical protein
MIFYIPAVWLRHIAQNITNFNVVGGCKSVNTWEFGRGSILMPVYEAVGLSLEIIRIWFAHGQM